MTHNEIFTKFMIEYDKADVTSSYPSLTDYEIAVLLDKAYLALIAQKITGNNIRRASIDSDIKSIADLLPLVETQSCTFTADSNIPVNVKKVVLPTTCQYFLNVTLHGSVDDPQDNITIRDIPVKLVSYEVATKFFATPYNLPWIKIPVCYILDGCVFIVHDTITPPINNFANVRYIKTPKKFVDDVSTKNCKFECSDTVAEELISLAITFALETVESTRLTTKLNTRGLEA